MSDVIAALAARHSQYALAGTSVLADGTVVDLVKRATVVVPSAFNSQSQRVAVLFGDEHRRLWNSIALEALRRVAVSEEAFAATTRKVGSFAAAHGTVLYFDDAEVTDGLAKRFPLYAANFPVWAEQSSGMLQLAVWTALSEAGLGASLQHYNPLIDDGVHEAFSIPASWRLIGQMPFGDVVAPSPAKDSVPVDDRVVVRGI
ncbi:nitroreductase family protein [uncultured Bifidobacterium sp.]|uniref:nitroreductase family protein n=1 Tax=uncultured Bifidobacterium sp. TaxID=165187 RepID=UPI0028DD3506|nr:nitroreductase family protein [uncultured Bifidobacterium sp.]